MTLGTNFDGQIAAGRASLKTIAAGTCDSDLFVVWVDIFFHSHKYAVPHLMLEMSVNRKIIGNFTACQWFKISEESEIDLFIGIATEWDVIITPKFHGRVTYLTTFFNLSRVIGTLSTI